MKKKAIFVANTGFALYHFRLALMKHLCDYGWRVVGLGHDESEYVRKFAKHKIRFIDIRLDHKGKNPVEDIAFVCRLNSIYKQEKPDLVHHFTIKPAIFGSIAAKRTKVPIIVNTITGLGYAFEKPGFLRNLVEHLYRFAFFGKPNVIFQNRDDFALFLSKGIVKRKNAHIILGSGVNTEMFRPTGTIDSKSGLTFLLISRMLWSKGIRQFAEAAEEIKKNFPNTRFIMVGGFSGAGARGNPDSIPREWLHNANQKGYVNWLGRVPLDSVITLLDNCDVFVLPSYYPEGIPRSLIEAAAKGKAIITTDTPGCREVVNEGVNGFLVSPKDTQSLAKAMTEFIQNPYLLKKMGKLSRKKAVELFDENKVIEKTMIIYKKVGAL